ncbi:uncharacterized protein FA14DRAFT_124399 [Meira miltonrushii]|uniref:FAS1 domain-containing protein n=1 Tax=Meira miltonrushii TaxID=1280837 RepID=A0A316V870_9BASI|nr:uncharacterized protein FA14DRAFT_124399 [Meira miltonrushii]PWN33670.1 hypothetical protein FA14DRAFT_124399 [Meira miltonrushii]
MGNSTLLFLFLYITIIQVASSQEVERRKTFSYQRRQNSPTVTNDQLTNALKGANLTKLAALFEQNPTVVQQINATPGSKTLLAPIDSALPFQSWANVPEALLYHVLNGSVPVDRLERLPMHTVLHSALTLQDVANLPGGNGQAVAMSTGTQGYPELSDYSPVVNEAQNTDSFLETNGKEESFTAGSLTILPINHYLTVPGNLSFTVGKIVNSERFATLLSSLPNNVNDARGLTVFVPSADAIQSFLSQHSGLSQQTLQAIAQNHVIINRAAYSPLLISQGSLITAGGQDLHVQQRNGTNETYTLHVSVGNATAQITQTDVMYKNGVAHVIDSVLFDTTVDYSRANQAAESAKASANSYISGPISDQNAASSQGTDVPPSPPGSSLPLASNSTVTNTYDATSGGTNPGAIAGAIGVGSMASVTSSAPSPSGSTISKHNSAASSVPMPQIWTILLTIAMAASLYA